MVYAARYNFKENEPFREGEYFAGDIKDLTKVIHEPVIFTGQNVLKLAKLENSIKEPVGDKSESGKSAPASSDLHNIKNVVKNEPVGYIKKYTINDSDKLSAKNEPVGSLRSNASRESNKSSESNHLVNKVNYQQNEPAQSSNSNKSNFLYVKAYENEPAGAWIAHLAMMRLIKRLEDNPQGLIPIYLKESTARVFVNRYALKKE
jgi:hypothetical protein